MTIQEILNEHKLVPAYQGPATCTCEEWESRRTGLNSRDQHRAHLAEVLDKHMQEREAKAWDKAKRAVGGIPFWTDGTNHGFDLWENEDGIAQESGARIEVMNILDNNPFNDSYVDPYADRPKRENGRRKDTPNGR